MKVKKINLATLELIVENVVKRILTEEQANPLENFKISDCPDCLAEKNEEAVEKEENIEEAAEEVNIDKRMDDFLTGEEM
jgi:hypothetical protein